MRTRLLFAILIACLQEQVAAQPPPGQGPGQAPTPPPPIEVTISGTLSLTGSSNVEESQEALRGLNLGLSLQALLPQDHPEQQEIDVKLDIRDDQGDPQRCWSLYNEMAQTYSQQGQGYQIFLGPISQSLSEAAANVTITNEQLMILPFTSLPAVQAAQSPASVFSLDVPTTEALKIPVFQVAQGGAKTFAIWQDADPFYTEMCAGAAAEAVRLGMELVFQRDLASSLFLLEQTRQIAAARPDVLVVCQDYKSSVELMVTLDFIHFQPNAFVIWDSSNSLFYQPLLVASGIDILGADLWSNRHEPCGTDCVTVTRAEFFQNYESQYGTIPSIYAGQAAAAGIAVTYLIRNAFSSSILDVAQDSEKLDMLSAEMRNQDAPKGSFYHPLTFNNQGYLVSAIVEVTQLSVLNTTTARRLQPQTPPPQLGPSTTPAGEAPSANGPPPVVVEPITSEQLSAFTTLQPTVKAVYVWEREDAQISAEDFQSSSVVEYPRLLEEQREVLKYPCSLGFEVRTMKLWAMINFLRQNVTGGPQSPCEPCERGYFRSEIGSTCESCPAGTHATQEAQSECTECLQGTVCLPAETDRTIFPCNPTKPGGPDAMDAAGPQPAETTADSPDGAQSEGAAHGPSKKLRLGSCVASLLVLVSLVWACISERWHCFEVQVAPAEVYQMFQAVTSILPDTGQSAMPSSDLGKDEEPKIAFELEAGLWSTSAVDLCRPKEKAFTAFVDEKKCQAKLSRFCYNILDEKPKNPAVRHLFKICQKAVHHGSVSFSPLDCTSLVLLPFVPHQHKDLQDFDSLDGLRANLQWQDGDSDPDVCETLVNCELLAWNSEDSAERRPWNFVMIGLVILALLVTATSTAFFARAIFAAQDSRFLARGCHTLFITALILVALIVLDIYIGEKFAVEDVFRTEDLFYYMLPDGIPKPASSLVQLEVLKDPSVWPKRLQKRLALGADASLMPGEEALHLPTSIASSVLELERDVALREIPAAKWQNALMVLCGNLMSALVSGQMSTFLEPLKDAAKRAWGKSDKVLSTWLLYLEKSLVDAPDHGNSFLTSLLDDLGTMKPVDDLCAKENCGAAQIEQIKALGQKYFGHFREVFKELPSRQLSGGQDKIAETRTLIGRCRTLLQKIKRVWNSVREPVGKILELVVEAVKSVSSDGVLGLLNTVVNTLGQPEKLFTDFPKIVVDVKTLADSFVALIQGFNTALEQLQVAAEMMKTELRQGMSNAKDTAKDTAISIRFKAGEVLDEKMAQAASIWRVTTDKQIKQEEGEEVQELPPVSGEFLELAKSLLQNSSQDGNGTSALQTSSHSASDQAHRGGDYPLLSILASFATGGSLCSPAARIGSIFLSESFGCNACCVKTCFNNYGSKTRQASSLQIEYMHSEKRGFSTSRGGIFKHFGYITFGLIILTAAIFAGYAIFLLGCAPGFHEAYGLLLPCAVKERCLGENLCLGNSRGVRCDQCNSGYATDPERAAVEADPCQPCDQEWAREWPSMIIEIGMYLLLYVILLLAHWSSCVSLMSTSCFILRAAVNHLQFMAITLKATSQEFITHNLQNTQEYFVWMSTLILDPLKSFPIECLSSTWKRYQVKAVLGLSIIPAVVVTAAVLSVIWEFIFGPLLLVVCPPNDGQEEETQDDHSTVDHHISFKKKGKSVHHSASLGLLAGSPSITRCLSRVAESSLIWCHLLLPMAIYNLLDVLRCVDPLDEAAGVVDYPRPIQVQVDDFGVECGQGDHSLWTILAIAGIILYGMGVPAGMAAMIQGLFTQDSWKSHRAFGYIIDGSSNDYLYIQIIIMFLMVVSLTLANMHFIPMIFRVTWLLSLYCIYSLIISDVVPFDARDKTVLLKLELCSMLGQMVLLAGFLLKSGAVVLLNSMPGEFVEIPWVFAHAVFLFAILNNLFNNVVLKRIRYCTSVNDLTFPEQFLYDVLGDVASGTLNLKGLTPSSRQTLQVALTVALERYFKASSEGVVPWTEVCDPKQSEEAEPERDVLDPARPGPVMGRWV
eukprot:s2689_g17.t1